MSSELISTNLRYLIILFFVVFIAPDLSKSRQKILSQFHVDIGSMSPNSSKVIHFNVVSLVEGTIDLSQLIKYQTKNAGSLPNDGIGNEKELTVSSQTKNNHNINIEYVNDVVIKSKMDSISIPCTAEFIFTGNFYSLSKEPLTKAYKNEDFLFRVVLEIKSVDIDILDMFLISVSIKHQTPAQKIIFC